MRRHPTARRSRTATILRCGLATLVATATLAAGGLIATGASASAAPATAPDLARFGTISADKVQNDPGTTNGGYFPASNMIDGDDTTRWASGNGTDSASASFTSVITEDLGAPATISGLGIDWEAAYASGYRIEVATEAPDQAASWTQVYQTSTGTGGTADSPTFAPVQARYVRLDLDQRAAVGGHYYGYSIYTLSIWGSFDTPQVGFAGSGTSVPEGGSATVPIMLSAAADTDQTVHVTSTDGTAKAGTDFTKVDQDVTIPAGETVAEVSVSTVDEGPLASTRSLTLTLSSSSDVIAVNPSLASSTVTITPTGTPQDAGTSTLLEGFQNGVPSAYFTWAASNAPTLSTAAASDVPGASVDNLALVATVPATSSYFGFTYEPKNADGSDVLADWSAYDGFSFWFLGKNTGKTFSFELHNRNASNVEQGFTANVVDNVAGWRKVSVLFKDLKPKSGNTIQRFNPSISTGFAVTLTNFAAAGDYTFDDFSLFTRATLLDDFEPPFAPGDAAAQTGWFPTADGVTLGVTSQDRGNVADNHVLSGTYQLPAGTRGGVSDNLTYSQDWSGFRGIEFWWYASEPTEPASATTGADIPVEIKDGGPDAAHSEIWTATFKDNWADGSRWRLVQLPFSAFQLADDSEQRGSEATRDGVLNLTSTWGISLDLPAGTADAVPYALDDVELYGTPPLFTDVSVSVPDVTLVDAGQTAHVQLTLTTASGKPTASATAIKYATGTTTASATTDYTPVSGTLTFPQGTESGTTMSFDVPTLAGADQASALQIPLTITNAAVTLPSTAPIVVINAHGYPYLDSSLSIADRVSDLMSRMSLADKVGQMAQAERGSITNPRQIAQLGLGSILSGGGSVPAGNTPDAWASMIDGFQREALANPLQIPIVYGADAVHGHSNVKDATIYPHNIGLGATRDPALVQKIGEETASETRTTGVTWAFAPCLCVSRDERWGRTYESYGEDPALVSSFAGSVIRGLQGSDPTDKSAPDEVLATAKHWAGDGGTTYDASKAGTGAYPIDQGITNVTSEQQFETLFATPYVPAIDAGVGSIMPSYSSVSINGATPVKMTANKALDTDLLKGTMGFDGFLISDWQAIGQIPGDTYEAKAITAVNAGLDMAMEPSNYTGFISAIEDGVTSGQVSQDRIDDAVARILTQKFELGLFEKPFTDASQRNQFGGAAHRATAAEAAAESQVLLKNTHDALPLAKTGKLYVAGSNADDLGNQMGGWTLSWQGGSGNGMTTGTTILDGIEADAPNLDVTYSKDASAATSGYDEGLVVVGETPYAEGQGDVGNNGHTLNLSATDTQAINTVCGAMKCVVLVISGRPQLISNVVPKADAVVAGFLPGSEGEGVASVLLGDQPFTGRLPLSWPAGMDQIPVNVGDANYDPEFAYGWGIRTDSPRSRLTGLVGSLTGSAKTDVQALLDADVWNADGALSDPGLGLRLLATAAQDLSQVDASVVAAASVQTAQQHPLDPSELQQASTLVSLARDLAQQAIEAQGDSPAASDVSATADAEHYLESGDAYDAARLLSSVAGVDVTAAQAAAPVATTTPSIAGAARVGSKLTVDPGVWSVPGSSFAYQWAADGTDLAGATGSSYTATVDDLGKRLTVTVTASKTGHADGTATTAATAPVAAGSLTATVRPAISGTAKLGRRLTAHPGTWSAPGATYRYQWSVGGKAIRGATGSTYVPAVADVGRTIAVTVTAHHRGYADGSATSRSTAPVARGTITSTRRPTISGPARVGKRLTAHSGGWSVGGLTVHYQWYAAGRAIRGATGSSLKLGSAQRGRRITVLVTVSRAGYATASARSTATSAVRR